MNAAAALPLLDVRVPEVYERLDAVSAHDFLDAVCFPESARHLAFEVFSRSFFADPRLLSAAEMALMFHIYFLGSSEGLLFDVPTAPFPAALWKPLAALLERHGADLRTSTPVEHVEPLDDGGYDRHRPGRAAPRHRGARPRRRGAARPRRPLPPARRHPWRERIARLRNAPPFLVSRLWLDRRVAPDRPGFLGTSGYGTSTTSASSNGTRTRPPAGPPAPAAPSSNCTPTPCPRRRPRRSNRSGCSTSCTASTRRPARRGSSTPATSGAPTAALPGGRLRGPPSVRTPDPGLMVAGDLVRTSCRWP